MDSKTFYFLSLSQSVCLCVCLSQFSLYFIHLYLYLSFCQSFITLFPRIFSLYVISICVHICMSLSFLIRSNSFYLSVFIYICMCYEYIREKERTKVNKKITQYHAWIFGPCISNCLYWTFANKIQIIANQRLILVFHLKWFSSNVLTRSC